MSLEPTGGATSLPPADRSDDDRESDKSPSRNNEKVRLDLCVLNQPPLVVSKGRGVAAKSVAAAAAETGGDGGNDRALDGDIDRPCSLTCLSGGSCQLSTDAEVAQLGRSSKPASLHMPCCRMRCGWRHVWHVVACEGSCCFCTCPLTTCITCPPSSNLVDSLANTHHCRTQCGFYETGVIAELPEMHEDEPHADGANDGDANDDATAQQQVDAELVAEEKCCLHGAPPCKVTVDAVRLKSRFTHVRLQPSHRGWSLCWRGLSTQGNLTL